MKSALFLVLESLLFWQCITTALPRIVIPEEGGKASFSAAFGSNGINCNAVYAAKSKVAVLGNFGSNGFAGHGELSLGFFKKENFLLSVGAGAASFTARPLTYGGTNDIIRYWGSFTSFSIRFNKQLQQGAGFINSLILINGTDNGRCAQIFGNCHGFSDRPFSALYYEPVFYVRGHRNKYRYFLLGGTLKIQAPEDAYERMFDFMPLYIGFGFSFPKPKEKS